ncbi:D-2-hydroxyacid dehydrogenase family protein [Ramlibacter sp. WS9]|uniref:D-2-hydroxyacid dehydrogenase family protein n=1 Tax=Ramlibacter sp. WS9 TaxID=1882741 RepID=UPI0011434A79|nr:D-2-hydroxyacid dehydrogenase family protein [Ramlibacter sp. WS9]ROZ78838.1 D-2-hydroxyacid dehydrogenase family protein [Ramlibacter sp. WS9]
MKIAILDDYADIVRHLDCFSALDGHEVTILNDYVSDVDLLAKRVRDAEALVLLRERTPVGEALLERLPNLKLITQNGHVPHIDLDACTNHGVVVCSALTSRPSYAAAELTWGLILSAMRHIPFEAEALKQGRWQSTIGRGLRGRTLGILGYGRIGKVIAQYAKAFEMSVLVWERENGSGQARKDGHDIPASREEFFAQSDVLSLHVRLNEETRGSVTAHDLACMKPTALLVNTSRAELISPGVLATALKAGRPGMAAVDVFENEPVFDGKDPLLALPNALCTPHIGYVEVDNHEIAYGNAFKNIIAFDAGKPINVHNPEAVKGMSFEVAAH